jgi:hypothetical protein
MLEAVDSNYTEKEKDRNKAKSKEKDSHNKQVNAFLVQSYNNRIQSFLVEMLENPKEIKEYKNKEYNFLDKDSQISDYVRKGFYFSNFKNGEKERIVSKYEFIILISLNLKRILNMKVIRCYLKDKI